MEILPEVWTSLTFRSTFSEFAGILRTCGTSRCFKDYEWICSQEAVGLNRCSVDFSRDRRNFPGSRGSEDIQEEQFPRVQMTCLEFEGFLQNSEDFPGVWTASPEFGGHPLESGGLAQSSKDLTSDTEV